MIAASLITAQMASAHLHTGRPISPSAIRSFHEREAATRALWRPTVKKSDQEGRVKFIAVKASIDLAAGPTLNAEENWLRETVARCIVDVAYDHHSDESAATMATRRLGRALTAWVYLLSNRSERNAGGILLTLRILDDHLDNLAKFTHPILKNQVRENIWWLSFRRTIRLDGRVFERGDRRWSNQVIGKMRSRLRPPGCARFFTRMFKW